MPRFTLDLDDRRARDPLRCGDKAANLSILSARGIPVPDGFVVTTALFEEMRRDADPVRLRERLLDAPLPEAALEGMRRSLARLGGPVAVRSSMVGEDRREHSFAGILESHLGRETEAEVIESVRRCMASALSDRARSYLREIEGGSSAPGPVAVLVQRMVRAEAGGVAFTADPATGKRCVVVEATPGGAAGVASGTVIPQRYVLDGECASRSAGDGRPPLLGTERLEALRGIIDRVESVLGERQDIEWALEDGRFLILQSRPITAFGGAAVYSTRMVSDMVPGIVQPLLWSTNVLDMTENVFRPLFTALLGPVEFDWRSLVGRFHSRVYENATGFGALLARLGMPGDTFEQLALCPSRRPRRPSAAALARRAPRLIRFLAGHARFRGAARAFCERHERELVPFRSTDPAALDPPALLEQVRELRRMHAGTQWHMWIGAMNMAVRNRVLRRYAQRRAPDIDPGALVRGGTGLLSLEPDEAMRSLAASLPRDAGDLLACMERGDDRAVRARLALTPEGRRVAGEFDRFMDRYGFLGTNGVDFTIPPWRETPGLIWSAVARLAAAGEAPADERPGETTGEAVEAVRSRLGPWGRVVFGRLLESTRVYLGLRERMSFLMCEDAWQMRRAYLALGRRLAAGGSLRNAEDVFRLEWDELAGLVEGRLAAGKARDLARRRAEEMAADAAAEPEDVIFTVGGRIVPAPPAAAPGNRIEGIPGSGGLARGRALIVRDPAAIARPLTRDDILVVPSTDAGWTTVLPAVGGIVAESGGQLSHSAIIAREFGIPAVVGLRRATSLIKDGEPLTVDGFRGTVYLERGEHGQE